MALEQRVVNELTTFSDGLQLYVVPASSAW